MSSLGWHNIALVTASKMLNIEFGFELSSSGLLLSGQKQCCYLVKDNERATYTAAPDIVKHAVRSTSKSV
jgi:hypothetical protein